MAANSSTSRVITVTVGFAVRTGKEMNCQPPRTKPLESPTRTFSLVKKRQGRSTRVQSCPVSDDDEYDNLRTPRVLVICSHDHFWKALCSNVPKFQCHHLSIFGRRNLLPTSTHGRWVVWRLASSHEWVGLRVPFNVFCVIHHSFENVLQDIQPKERLKFCWIQVILLLIFPSTVQQQYNVVNNK